MAQFVLKEGFNRYFQDGCTTFTKHEVLAYGAANRRHIEECLADWESKGFIKVLKPLDTAADGDVIVKVLKTIKP